MMLRLALAVALLFSAAGCDALRGDASERYSVSAFARDDGAAFLTVAGAETFSCASIPLLVEADVAADALTVRILGVGERPAVCAAAIGPATWTTRLPAPLPDGYCVWLRRGGDVDRYRLRRVGAGLEVEVEEASFSSVQESG